MRQEGRRQGTTFKRMTQPSRTGQDINWLEPTSSKIAEDQLPVDPDPHYMLIVIH